MKRRIRLVWLLVSGAWFIWLHSIPVLQWARFPQFNPPQGLVLWLQILRDWRHSWLFFAIVVILLCGLVLDLAQNKAAVYVNVGFYIIYILLWLPGVAAVLRGTAEPEAVAYMIAFGGSALITLVVNALLYRNWRRVISRRDD